MNAKTTRIRKASPRTGLKSNPGDKKCLPLTDYLLEEHPELGFPMDRALAGKSELNLLATVEHEHRVQSFGDIP